MELKKRNWSCRYVCDYLAIGEAPDQIRNCFQQRSRWTKVCPRSNPSEAPARHCHHPARGVWEVLRGLLRPGPGLSRSLLYSRTDTGWLR